MKNLDNFSPPLVAVLAIAMSPCMRLAAETRNRAEFCKRLADISRGMPLAEVAHRLGKPDERRSDASRTGETWYYGLESSTYGPAARIIFDKQQRVSRIGVVEAIPGDAPSAAVRFDPQELARLLRLLQQPVFTVDRRRPAFDPLVLLTIVNRLQPLGKEKILALAERCVGDRRHDDDASVTLGLALLVLFEVPADPGFLPGLAILDTWPYRSSNRMESPRYPIAVVGDVPILLAREASGFGVHGIGPSRTVVQSLYYPRFRVREHPLVPKDDPFELVAMLKKTAPWFFEPVALRDGLWTPESGPWYPPRSGPQSGEKAVARQVLSLIGATIDPRPDVGEWGDEEFDKRWASARNTFLALQPRWDAKRGMFTISRQTRKVPSARDSRQSE